MMLGEMDGSADLKQINAHMSDELARARGFLRAIETARDNQNFSLGKLESLIATLTKADQCRIEIQGIGHEKDSINYHTWTSRFARHQALKKIFETNSDENYDLVTLIEANKSEWANYFDILGESPEQFAWWRFPENHNAFFIIWKSADSWSKLEIAEIEELLWLSYVITNELIENLMRNASLHSLHNIFFYYHRYLAPLSQTNEKANFFVENPPNSLDSLTARLCVSLNAERFENVADDVFRVYLDENSYNYFYLDCKWIHSQPINFLKEFQNYSAVPGQTRYVVIPQTVTDRLLFHQTARSKSDLNNQTWIIPLDQTDLRILLGLGSNNARLARDLLKSHRDNLVSRDLTSGVREIVFVIHGIRTRADWIEALAKEVETHSRNTVRVIPIKYGFFDLISFWAPPLFGFRERPIQAVEKQMALYRSLFPKGVVFSVVAHSFGTHIVSKILEKQKPRFRVIFLWASVVDQDFPWPQYKDCVGKVWNDYSTRDVWPALAKTLSWGYGEAGTHGFHNAVIDMVINREHDLGHCDYCDNAFQKRHFFPFLFDDYPHQNERKPGDSPSNSPVPTSHWICRWLVYSLSHLIIRFIVIVFLLLAVFWFGLFVFQKLAL